ncbi:MULTISPECIES: tripartite tricarboxylate transporter TctB family protein [unclassified Chelatococcus]|uniref:tripartite tricarboxylate transporter TctB family protein n=1 Tax=unclassified Chelatococcus TaxID=2638111 RepID=UPI001BD19C2A|nr:MULTISPECIES: tripartite tricarboxylate transporter TctB family protein [unclassified Chelatococcus]MBS7699988.1 tripartite tricarboxylate transporter TctB family protein [Chelatococcus sp. YT9]MBX3558587.1 tripartite tricarboxylate transporter TctB family protein [Chelatococcus sp.]
MDINRKDLTAGLIFIAFAATYGYMSLNTMSVGTATQMGPGFFPAMLAACLAVTGVAVIVRAFSSGCERPFGVVPWRAITFLSLATVVFAAFADQLGMLPGTFVTTFTSCLASPRISLRQNLLISICLAVFCSLVFSIGLNVPLPIIGGIFRS